VAEAKPGVAPTSETTFRFTKQLISKRPIPWRQLGLDAVEDARRRGPDYDYDRAEDGRPNHFGPGSPGSGDRTAARTFSSRARPPKPLGDLGRYDAVAVLDAASGPTSIRPALVAEAIASARSALGDDRYTSLQQLGKTFSPSELQEFLLQLAAQLD
jgi:hypothetical protein